MLEASQPPAVSDSELPRIAVAETARRVAIVAPPPRLGVAHLMLWVACWAVYMAVMRRMFAVEPGAVGLLLLAAVGFGATLSWAGLAVFVTRRLRGAAWPIAPGEWLLAALGLQLALELLLEGFAQRLVHSTHHIADVLMCCFLLLPLLGRETLPWKLAFGLLILVIALGVLVPFLVGWGWLSPQSPLAVWVSMPAVQSANRIAIVLCAAAVDRCRQRRSGGSARISWMSPRRSQGYGWLHTLGLSVFAYYAAVQMALGF